MAEEIRGRLRTSMVNLVEWDGPPWHDEKAMENERGNIRTFRGLERADRGEPARCGRTPIITGRVLSDR
eukprot:14208839-Heterocapsa_arctica.AAC.1